MKTVIAWTAIISFCFGMLAGRVYDAALGVSHTGMDRKAFEHGVLLGAHEGIELYKRSLLGEEFADPTGTIMSNAYAASPFIKPPTK